MSSLRATGRSPRRCGAWASGTTTERPVGRRRRRRIGWCLPAIAGEPARPRIVLVNPGNTAGDDHVPRAGVGGRHVDRRCHLDDPGRLGGAGSSRVPRGVARLRDRDPGVGWRHPRPRRVDVARGQGSLHVCPGHGGGDPAAHRRRADRDPSPRGHWCASDGKFLAIIGVVCWHHRNPHPSNGVWRSNGSRKTHEARPQRDRRRGDRRGDRAPRTRRGVLRGLSIRPSELPTRSFPV